MLLSFIVDHPDPSTLEHALHLLWSGCGGKVNIFWTLPRQQVTYCTSGYPQLILVLLKQIWKIHVLTGVRQLFTVHVSAGMKKYITG